MEIIKEIPEDITTEELTELIDDNIRTTRRMASETKKAQAEKMLEPITITLKEPFEIEMTEVPLDDDIHFDDDEFEEAIKHFFGKIDFLDDITLDSIKEKLPDPLDYDYQPILLRLAAELLKQNSEICQIISEESLQPEEVTVLEKDLEKNKQKMTILRTLLSEKEEEKEEENEQVQNKFIFVPNISGSPCVLNEIKHIDPAYYEKFISLFDSIKTGKFKNFARFTAYDIFEVKDFKVRVLFARLTPDTYALISAFTKKVTTSKGYTELVNLRAANYFNSVDSLKANLDNEEFMKIQSDYEQELYNILGVAKDKPKVMTKKGDKND